MCLIFSECTLRCLAGTHDSSPKLPPGIWITCPQNNAPKQTHAAPAAGRARRREELRRRRLRPSAPHRRRRSAPRRPGGAGTAVRPVFPGGPGRRAGGPRWRRTGGRAEAQGQPIRLRPAATTAPQPGSGRPDRAGPAPSPRPPARPPARSSTFFSSFSLAPGGTPRMSYSFVSATFAMAACRAALASRRRSGRSATRTTSGGGAGRGDGEGTRAGLNFDPAQRHDVGAQARPRGRAGRLGGGRR